MARLNVKRRTVALDDAKEVALGKLPDGTDVWTTVGEQKMSGDDKLQLAHNLRGQRHAARVADAVEKAEVAMSAFVERVLTGVMPDRVLDSYQGATPEERGLFNHWMKQAGFTFETNGLRVVVLFRGKVLADAVPVRVPHDIETDVVRELKRRAGTA